MPSRGSVGASGDLAPLAHLALPLIGRGEVEFRGSVVPAMLALRETGLEPLVLEAKEGLALLNGTQLMSAIAALLLADADRLARTASVATAITVEALQGTDVAYAAALQLARPHPGQIAVAAELRHLLRDSGLMAAHHTSTHKVQDPYSLRCVPQVHGAIRDALDHLRRVLDVEMNAATDNPLIFPEGGEVAPDTAATGGGLVISGGNFHGEPIALALDFAKLALSELGAISERRIALLVDHRLNGGLPPFLAEGSGLNSGMMIYQYAAAALASENKVLVHPASADSIPTIRQPGGPRLDGRDGGAPRPRRAGQRGADPGGRTARGRAGARPPDGARPGRAPGRRRGGRPRPGSAPSSRISAMTGSRGRTSPPPSASSVTGPSSISSPTPDPRRP